MPKLAVLNTQGSKVGELELADGVFGIEPNLHVLHEAVRLQEASERRGTHSTKTRSMVRGGGRKPWKQKGTGRARQGSIRSPQWVGGGVVFGPTPRSYSFKLPKKVRRLAIRSALSAKVRDNECIILDQISLDQPKTKEMYVILRNNLKVEKKALVVSENPDQQLILSTRNIPGVKVVSPEGINVRDVLNCERLIMTQGAVAKVEEVLGE